MRDSGAQEVRDPGAQEVRDSGAQEVRDPGAQEVRDSGAQEVRDPGGQKKDAPARDAFSSSTQHRETPMNRALAQAFGQVAAQIRKHLVNLKDPPLASTQLSAKMTD
ncbi:hypothetical protein [Acanthopleuribacter pedis]|uniref:Uncharacterized protein n=1 Tax=Acanthopleuribacter pedis TaxID=442870 RepID=A0A8J7QRB2_9BACT|nr:hypothetical protein [Acanthopleuribacter pedis]MBO1322898.1 hypothetical protein [Acanthopleuribacter pedis]